MEPKSGFEPETFSLPRKRSTPELFGQIKHMREMFLGMAVRTQNITFFDLFLQSAQTYSHPNRIADRKFLKRRISVVKC